MAMPQIPVGASLGGARTRSLRGKRTRTEGRHVSTWRHRSKRARIGLISSIMVIPAVLAAVALADRIVTDGDIIATGDQSTVNLGPVAPGATVQRETSFKLECSGNQHVERGADVDLNFSLADSTVPAGGSLSATNTSTGATPATWPLDNTQCPASPPAPIADLGNSTVTITAPTAPGTYSYKVRWTASSAESSDVQGDVLVTYDLTVPSDTTAPHVTSVSRDGSTPTNASGVSWTVQFNESVSGVDAADFGVTTTGTISGASVSSVSPAGPASSYTVTASTGSGSGSIGLNLVDDNSIKDAATNPLGTSSGAGDGGFLDRAPYSVDKTAPQVTSVTRGGSTPTNASSVSWTVQFSESVSGVGAGDFGLTTTGTISGASVTSVSPAGPASSYVVTALTGTGDGSIGLNLTDDDSITDAATNPLGTSSGAGDGGFLDRAPYTVDKSAPTITLATDDTAAGTGWFNIASDTGNDGIKVTGSASDPSGVAGLTCTRNGNPFISRTSAPFSDTQTLTDGTHSVSCTASDSLGNSTASGQEVTATYQVDLTAPSVGITSPAGGSTTIASPLALWSYSLALACGANTITASSTDVAGNTTTSAARTVTRLCFGVQYLQPLDQSTSTAVTNVGKYGRAIPVKVILSLLGGGAVDQAGLQANGLTLQMGVNPASCSSGTTTDDVEAYADAGQSSAGSNLFRWDTTGGQWIYNLDTKAPPGMAMAINSCYRLDVYVSDGTNKIKVSTSAYALFKPVK